MQERDIPATEKAAATATSEGRSPARRRYERPEIIDYGSVRDLTRGTGSKPTFDMMSGQRRLL